MADILKWDVIEETFGNDADVRNIKSIRGDLEKLNNEKADAGPIWKRVEEKADGSWVHWLEKDVVTKLRGEHDGLVQRVNEAVQLMEQLPGSLQDRVGAVLQSLCQTHFAAIGTLCEEKLALLGTLERQASIHADTAAARLQETETAARSGVEDIRREMEALRTLAERTQAEFNRRLQEAEEATRRAQESLQQCRDDAGAQLVAVQQARDEAIQAATNSRLLLAGCDSFWGRLRWLFVGPAR